MVWSGLVAEDLGLVIPAPLGLNLLQSAVSGKSMEFSPICGVRAKMLRVGDAPGYLGL